MVSTERLIQDELDESVFYSNSPIYNIVRASIWGKEVDIPQFNGRKIIFSYEIPEDSRVFLTYVADDGMCGECLTTKDMVRKFYKELYGVDSGDEIGGYDDETVVDYLNEALVVIRNIKDDNRTIRQYSFRTGSRYSSRELCDNGNDNNYRDIDNIPKEWIGMTKEGVYVEYQVVWGKVKFSKDFNIDTVDINFGYKLPLTGTIYSIKVDWREANFNDFQWYYFFEREWVVTVEYYSDILLSDECCIEFDEKFARLPVLYALFNTMYNRGDDRARINEKRYLDLLKQYKKYIRKKSSRDINGNKSAIPSKSYHRFRGRGSNGKYIYMK